MAINSDDAAASLQDIADVERRTREALCYAGSRTIFIVWGVLVALGYALAEWSPSNARVNWLGISIVGCIATAVIAALRMRAHPGEVRDTRVIWAIVLITAFGAAWSYVLGPLVPHHLMYAFQPSLVMLAIILGGVWLGRPFIILGAIGLALIAIGYLQPDPWLHWWMATVQSGTLIAGGVWLGRIGLPR